MTKLGLVKSPIDGKVLVSYSQNLAEGFTAVRIPLSRLADLVRYRGNYSATAFTDGYRDGAHALPGQELVILDFDGGYTIREASHDFGEYIGLIATTKNHMKTKHGIIAERFRLILPTNNPITLGCDAFKLMMTEIIASSGHADPACNNIDRMYFGNPEASCHYLEGAQLFDWKWYYRKAQAKRANSSMARYYAPRLMIAHDIDRSSKGYDTFFRERFKPGNRNNTLFQLACWMRDDGVDDIDYRIREFNAMSMQPLDESELTTMLRRFRQAG